ncbi:PH domain-containing protein [Haloglycomyces albus]|uniref:PH domain-containing protein n=1 Tax=Haloglycomyces albus TaxID=526067 RepID=UPI00046D7EAC|nr:PH domain-containing protein [Haloglycomyces albus]
MSSTQNPPIKGRPAWEDWPEPLPWQRLAPEFVAVQLIAQAISLLILIVVAVVGIVWWGELQWLWLAGGLWTAWAALRMWIQWRWAKSWRWVERDRDIVVKYGLLIRRLSIVPYGRIQLVDLKAGPIERIFGLTGITIQTAAMGRTTELPGLQPEVAAALRDRLATKAAEVKEGL